MTLLRTFVVVLLVLTVMTVLLTAGILLPIWMAWQGGWIGILGLILWSFVRAVYRGVDRALDWLDDRRRWRNYTHR